jgi:hypothetical protein
MSNKANFKINASLATDRGFEATSAQVMTIQLEDATDVHSVRFELYDAAVEDSPLATYNAPDLTFAGGVRSVTLSPASGSTTITMVTNGAETHSWKLRSTAVTSEGEYIYERIIALKNGKPRKPPPGESTEWTERGWADAWAELVDYVTGVVGGSGGYATIQDEGISLTQRSTINFTGAGVSVTDAGGITVVTIGGGGTGLPVATAAGQTIVWNGAAYVAGALDLADADAVTGLLPHAKVADLAGLSVLGRAGNTSGVMAAITGADGQALRVSGTTLGFGTLATASYTNSSVTLAKLADMATDSLLGRDTAGTGVPEVISLNATLSMTGTGSLQRAALTGDITAAAGSNVTAITAGVIIDADINTAAAIAVTKLAIGSSLQVLRTNVGATAAEWATVSTLSAGSAAGQTLIWNGSIWGAGALDLADADARTGLLPFANIANGSARSVFGRAANTAGVMAPIVGGGAGTVLYDDGATLSFIALGLATLPTIATDSLLGRDTAGTGAVEVIALNATLSMTGAGALQRAALTGDVTAAAGSNATTIANDAVTTVKILNSNVTYAKLQNVSAASRVLGRGSALGAGAVEELSLAGGLSMSGTTITIADGAITYPKLADGAALSVFGRSVNTAGPMSSISGADGQALRVSGTTLGFGALATAAYTDGSVTLAKLPNGAAASVLGRSGATVGVYADIASTADGQVLRRAAGVVGWGAVDLADLDGVTGLLAFANIANGSARSVLGRAANTAGVMAPIAGGGAGTVLYDNGTTISFQALTVGNIANVSTGVILGRYTAGTGPVEQVTLNSTLEFSAGSLQRAALTGDVTAAAGSNVTAIAAGVIVDADVNAAAAIAHTKLANGSARSVLGRAVNTVGALASIAGAGAGTVLVDNGTTLSFTTIGTTSIGDGTVTVAKLADLAGLSVLGRSASTTGDPAAITATATGQVLRYAGTTLAFGALDLADPDAVTGLLPFANIANGSARSVFGRAANTAGVMAAIAGAGAGTVLIDNGTTLAFGTLALSSLPTMATDSLLGRDTAGIGAVEVIALNATLSMTGTGQLQRAALTGDVTAAAGSNTTAIAAGVIVDADVNVAAAIAGTKIDPDFGGQNIISTGSLAIDGITNFGASANGLDPATAGILRLPNGTSEGIQFRNADNSANILGLLVDGSNQVILGDASGVSHILSPASGGNHVLGVGGASALTLASTFLELGPTVLRLRFSNALTAGAVIQIEATTTAGLTSQSLEIAGQDNGAVGGADTIAGAVVVRGGNSSDGTGGGLDLRSGTGTTTAGTFQARIGSTVFLEYPGNVVPATTGILRAHHNATVIAGRDSTNANNRNGVRWGVITNSWMFGDAAVTTYLTGATTSISGTTINLAADTINVSTNSSTSVQIAGSAIGVNELSGRQIVSLFRGAPLTTTEMPANTGERVLFWGETTGVFTSGMPVDGGILAVGSSTGLQWKGKNGVETTLALNGEGTNTTKRRFIDWKSPPQYTVSSSGTAFTAAYFDVNNINGQTLTDAILQVRARLIHASPPTYHSVVERTEIIRITGGVVSSSTLFPHVETSGDGGSLVVSIEHSGTTVQLRLTQNSTPTPTTTTWAFFEVTGFEL